MSLRRITALAVTTAMTAAALPATGAHAGTIQLISQACSATTFTQSASSATNPSQCSSPLTISASPAAGPFTRGAAGISTITAPDGLTIDQAALLAPQTGSNVGAPGAAEWAAGINAGQSTTYLTGPTGALQTPGGLGATTVSAFLQCQASSCADAATLSAQGISVTADETATPTLAPVLDTGAATTSNLLNVPAGQWIRATSSSTWDVAANASDPTGICQLALTESPGQVLSAQNQTPNQQAGWTECDNPVHGIWSVNPSQLVATTGHLILTVNAADAADNVTQISNNLRVDNVKPSVTYGASRGSGTAVRVPVYPHTGSSGLSRLTCTVDGVRTTPGPGRELIVATGAAHTVNCTAENYAVDSNGSHAAGSAHRIVDVTGRATVSGVAELTATGHRARRIRVSGTWTYRHGTAHLTALTAAPAGAKVTLRCRGRGCPHLTGTVANARNRAFASGDILTVTVSEAGYRSARVATKVRTGHRPLAVNS